MIYDTLRFPFGKLGLSLSLVGLSLMRGATQQVSSCSQAAVQSAITAAAINDTVLVPAGSCSWGGLIVDKAIRLQGAGVGLTNITITGENTINKQTTGVVRVSGFSFSKSGGGNASKGFSVGGAWTAEPVVIENNDFTISGTGLFLLKSIGGVIIAKNSFTGAWDDSFIQAKDDNDLGNSWGTADTMGVRDSTGKRNHYIEENTFYGGTNQGIDADDSVRVVYRFNTLTYSSFNSHGRDTSPIGVRHFEVYNNAFKHLGGSTQIANQNWAIWIRGGTGVIFNNQIDDLAGSFWGNKPEIKFSIRGAEDQRPQGTCASTKYPVPGQIGQSFNGSTNVTDPLYMWGNTGALAINADWNWGNPCGFTFSTYFQWGRDAVNNGTAKPGYVAYAYPHPLRTGSTTPPPPPVDTSAPTAPTNVSAAAISTVQIDLSWTASTDNIGVTQYLLERCQAASCTNFAQVGTATSPAFSDSALLAGTSYTYRIRAADAAGNLSVYSTTVSATTLQQVTSGPSPLPSGNGGIAASFPGDSNIKSHPDVLFADDFESYSSVTGLSGRWDQVYQQQYTRIATEPANVFSGGKSVEFVLPKQSVEVSNALVKNVVPSENTVFVRAYTKFESVYNAVGSTHNGIAITAQYSTPGVPANGTNKFYVDVENSRETTSDPTPGPSNLYIYHPEQRDVYGDHWYPTGRVVPFDLVPGNFGPYFVARPDFTPALNRWYCYELMVKANTPGQRDGRVALWIDGNLVADFLNVRLRDIDTLKIDQLKLEFHVKDNSIAQSKKWYDNVVVARSYIGPMVTGSTQPAPPTNLTVSVR